MKFCCFFSANKMKRRFSQPNERMARGKRKELNFISIIKKRNHLLLNKRLSVLPSVNKICFFFVFRFFSFASPMMIMMMMMMAPRSLNTNKYFISIHLVGFAYQKTLLVELTKHARKLNLILIFSPSFDFSVVSIYLIFHFSFFLVD